MRIRCAWRVVRTIGGRSGYIGLAGKPEETESLGRPRHRWEDNMKLYHKEIG
jgi:hypothetical protein